MKLRMESVRATSRVRPCPSPQPFARSRFQTAAMMPNAAYSSPTRASPPTLIPDPHRRQIGQLGRMIA